MSIHNGDLMRKNSIRSVIVVSITALLVSVGISFVGFVLSKRWDSDDLDLLFIPIAIALIILAILWIWTGLTIRKYLEYKHFEKLPLEELQSDAIMLKLEQRPVHVALFGHFGVTIFGADVEAWFEILLNRTWI